MRLAAPISIAPITFDIKPVKAMTFTSAAIAERSENSRKRKSQTRYEAGVFMRALIALKSGSAESIMRKRHHPERSAGAPISRQSGK